MRAALPNDVEIRPNHIAVDISFSDFRTFLFGTSEQNCPILSKSLRLQPPPKLSRDVPIQSLVEERICRSLVTIMRSVHAAHRGILGVCHDPWVIGLTLIFT